MWEIWNTAVSGSYLHILQTVDYIEIPHICHKEPPHTHTRTHAHTHNLHFLIFKARLLTVMKKCVMSEVMIQHGTGPVFTLSPGSQLVYITYIYLLLVIKQRLLFIGNIILVVGPLSTVLYNTCDIYGSWKSAWSKKKKKMRRQEG